MKRALSIILGFGILFGQISVPLGSASVLLPSQQEASQSQPAPQTSERSQHSDPPPTEPSAKPQQETPAKEPDSGVPEQVSPSPQEPTRTTPEQQGPTPAVQNPEANSSPQAPEQGPGGAEPTTTRKSSQPEPVTPSPKAKSKTKSAGRKSKARPKEVPLTVQDDPQPPKRVVREGGTSEPTDQLSPGISDAQASHARQNTDQLLASTDENLKKTAGRNLNATQQAMLAQIRKFMEQANEAVAAGDFQRGHNLAMKAHMLSDDLVKH